MIITVAVICRTDIADLRELLEEKGAKLYRGTGLTKQQLQKYRDLKGKKEIKYGMKRPVYMSLTGFISTSFDRAKAEGFAFSNEETCREATLFEILWKKDHSYYVMDMSPFPEEKEVLLFDGSKFEVLDVVPS